MHSALPSHLVEVLSTGDGAHNFGDNSGMVRCCEALPFFSCSIRSLFAMNGWYQLHDNHLS
jgi:hypothetical protein